VTRVFLSIGSNIDRETNIRAGVAALRECFGELRLSTVYESEAVGFEGDPFYNLVAGFETDITPEELVAALRAIEDRHGRVRTGPRFSSRTLDIDLLLYGDAVFDAPVVIPRKEITRNAFVLLPLAELAPDAVHPLTGKTYAAMWEAFDKASQPLWPVAFDCS
jgi:2-amino-4-hydroxy-6-hydroxymethyldihydropteridine diphosphokinase